MVSCGGPALGYVDLNSEERRPVLSAQLASLFLIAITIVLLPEVIGYVVCSNAPDHNRTPNNLRRAG